MGNAAFQKTVAGCSVTIDTHEKTHPTATEKFSKRISNAGTVFPISLPPLASLLKNKTEKGAAAAPDKKRHLPGVHNPTPIWPKLWGGKASTQLGKPGCRGDERGPSKELTAQGSIFTPSNCRVVPTPAHSGGGRVWCRFYLLRTQVTSSSPGNV